MNYIISVNDRVIWLSRKGFLFTKLRICKASQNLHKNFRIYSNLSQILMLLHNVCILIMLSALIINFYVLLKTTELKYSVHSGADD